MYYNFQFLVEDASGSALVDAIMEKVASCYPGIEYECWPFQGLGGFTKRNTAKETKTGKLLNDLATRLRAYSKSLAYTPAAVIVVMDNDDRVTEDFYAELRAVAERNSITADHAFCIAVEEMEAWLLGDEAAVISAYPKAKQAPIQKYVQDSICGTWEVLAEAVYPGGVEKFKADCPTYREKGEVKREWAVNIGKYMDLRKNKSPSFQHFLSEITQRIPGK